MNKADAGTQKYNFNASNVRIYFSGYYFGYYSMCK